MKVRRFQASDAGPIARLNDRLRAGSVTDVVYPEGVEQHWKGSIRQRLYVADDDGEIRGGVWLKEQPFRINGADVVCGWLKYPVAESLINPRFSGVPGSLIMQCLREQPRLMALGLGGHGHPLPRMLKALRWRGTSVPMLVRPLRPARCLRELAPLRRTAGRRVVADLLAFTGLGWLGMRALDVATVVRGGLQPRGYTAEACPELGSWADETWRRTRDTYGFIGARDAATVESALPPSPDIHRLRVRLHGNDVGWVYVVRHDFSVGEPDRNFGRLTVGLIGDCLAAPEHAAGVMGRALDFLLSSGTDIAISNQLHPVWQNSLRRLGFVEAASNFAFYSAPKATELATDLRQYHINRGDCDGPMWYAGR